MPIVFSNPEQEGRLQRVQFRLLRKREQVLIALLFRHVIHHLGGNWLHKVNLTCYSCSPWGWWWTHRLLPGSVWSFWQKPTFLGQLRIGNFCSLPKIWECALPNNQSSPTAGQGVGGTFMGMPIRTLGFKLIWFAWKDVLSFCAGERR